MITTHQFLANCLRGAIAALALLSKSKSARASKENRKQQDKSMKMIGTYF
jgi:hypothetical protein